MTAYLFYLAKDTQREDLSSHICYTCVTLTNNLQIQVGTCEVYFLSLQILASVCQFECLALDQTLNQQLSKRLPER